MTEFDLRQVKKYGIDRLFNLDEERECKDGIWEAKPCGWKGKIREMECSYSLGNRPGALACPKCHTELMLTTFE